MLDWNIKCFFGIAFDALFFCKVNKIENNWEIKLLLSFIFFTVDKDHLLIEWIEFEFEI